MTKYRLRRIGVASNASPARPTLSDCIELVLGQSGSLADDVLDALKRQLAQYEGEPHDDGPGEAVKAAIRTLLADANAVRAGLGSELRRLAFHSSSKDLAQGQAVHFEDLRFFDIREIEIHIELALARQEVVRATDNVLPMFDSLVSALLGWSTIQPGLNPLKPETFVRALLETLTAWVPNEDVRMDLLRPAAIALGLGLHDLYREASEWMRSQGVHPVEIPRGHSRDGAAARARKAQTEVERTMQTLDKLRRLLAGEPQIRAADTFEQRDFTYTVPGALVALQDLKLVEPMMQRLAERSVRQLAQGKSAIVGSFIADGEPRSTEHNRQVGRMLGEEVVSMMVDQLVNDERLLMPVRMQLRALEPALLQLARSDPRFFIDRRHAARQLLDRVVQRSLACPADDDDAISDFAACVSDAVNGLTRSAGDAAAYAGILVELEKAWDAADETRRRQREDARLAQQHAQQRRELAQRFSDAMMERFRNSNLPELVASFLRGPWSQVLAESHLQGGGQSDPRGFLALVDDLVWSVQLTRIRQDHTRLVRLVPRLLSRLHEGLVLIRYPQEPITIFLDELSALHDHVLDEHRRAVASARASAQAQQDSDAREAQDSRDSEAQDSRDSEAQDSRATAAAERRQLDAAEHGEWLPADQSVGAIAELLLGGEWIRARLTWIGRNRNLFMFVSGGGLSHAMSRRTMDRLYAQERIRVVTPAFDILIESGMAPLAADEPRGAQSD